MQFIDKVFDVSVVQVQQVPRMQSVRRQSSSHSCSPLSMDTVVDMPVVVKRQMAGGSCSRGSVPKIMGNREGDTACAMEVPQMQRPCDHAALRAVFMAMGWLMGAGCDFAAVSRSSRSSGVERHFWEPSMVKSSSSLRAGGWR